MLSYCHECVKEVPRYLWHKFQVNTINTTQCYYEISAAGKKDSSNHTRDQKSLGLIGLSL